MFTPLHRLAVPAVPNNDRVDLQFQLCNSEHDEPLRRHADSMLTESRWSNDSLRFSPPEPSGHSRTVRQQREFRQESWTKQNLIVEGQVLPYSKHWRRFGCHNSISSDADSRIYSAFSRTDTTRRIEANVCIPSPCWVHLVTSQFLIRQTQVPLKTSGFSMVVGFPAITVTTVNHSIPNTRLCTERNVF